MRLRTERRIVCLTHVDDLHEVVFEVRRFLRRPKRITVRGSGLSWSYWPDGPRCPSSLEAWLCYLTQFKMEG